MKEQGGREYSFPFSFYPYLDCATICFLVAIAIAIAICMVLLFPIFLFTHIASHEFSKESPPLPVVASS